MSESIQSSRQAANEVRFSVAAHAAWAPGRETPAAWLAWAVAPIDADRATDASTVAGTATTATKTITKVTETSAIPATGNGRTPEPALSLMPAMLRRRASQAGKMALQAAYAACGALSDAEIPVIFCSRHGECLRSADLLTDLAQGLPLSPTAFSLSVHNATGGLFSIARHDHANSLALAAGHSTVEHAVIEACGLLADGAAAVLLVAADGQLPAMYREFADCDEQAFGWAWLLQSTPAGNDIGAAVDAVSNTISLRWTRSAASDDDIAAEDASMQPAAPRDPGLEPGALQVMRFFLNGAASLQRTASCRRWIWSRNA